MKKATILIVMAFSIATISYSCKKEDDQLNSTSNNTQTQSMPGNWKVSLYVDNNVDETYHYSSYTFEFNEDGGFIARTAGDEFAGTWTRTIDDSKPRLVINISGNDDLFELSDDWVIISISESKIQLEDDNVSDQEKLQFSINL